MKIDKSEKFKWILSVFLATLIGIIGCGQANVDRSDFFPFWVPGDIRWTQNATSFDFKSPFPWFNKTYERIFIRASGEVSFFSGDDILDDLYDCPRINLFKGDVPWRDALDPSRAMIFYRETTDRILLQKAAREVFKAFPEFWGITLSWMFIVTWHRIPYPNCNDKDRSIVQEVFTTDGHHSFVILYYNAVDWKLLHSKCDRNKLFPVIDTCESTKLTALKESNIDEPGKWVFRVDSDLRTANCQEFEESMNKLRITPSFVSFGSREPLQLKGPCFDRYSNFTCVFEDYDINGSIVEVVSVAWPSLNLKSVICPMPHLSRAGRVRVRLDITKFEKFGDPKIISLSYSGYIYLVNDDKNHFSQILTDRFSFQLTRELDNDTLLFEAWWDPTFFERDIELEHQIFGSCGHNRSLTRQPMDVIVESFDGLYWKSQGSLLQGIKNTGKFNRTLNNSAVQLLNRVIFTENMTSLSIHLQRSNLEGEDRKCEGFIWSNLGANIMDTIFFIMNIENITSCPGVHCAEYGQRKCDEWFNSDSLIPLPTDTLPCPPTAELAELDSHFEQDRTFMSGWTRMFHPGGHVGFRQRNPSSSGAGSQCVYDIKGELMVGPMEGGTLTKYSPNFDLRQHLIHDIFPFAFCCKMSGDLNTENCATKYYARRPSDNGENYLRPWVISAMGDPHIITFDGLRYTFNGVGEFYMVSLKHENVTFQMQARMEQYISPENVPMNASVFTAAVMQEERGNTTITIQVSLDGDQIAVMLDEEIIDLNGASPRNLTVRHKSSSVTFESSTRVMVTFSSGFSFTFSTVGPNEMALNIFGITTSKLCDECKGLLGNADGIPINDLLTPSGFDLWWNSSPERLHKYFGVKWRVPENSSIFTYPRLKSYHDYNKPQFKPNFPNGTVFGAVPQSINDKCEEKLDCVFDYITTGSKVLASKTKEVIDMYRKAYETVQKHIGRCPSVKSPENGFVLMTNLNVGGTLSFHCLTGYQLRKYIGKCKCLENSIEDDPKWHCSSRELEEVEVNCVKESDIENWPTNTTSLPNLTDGEVSESDEWDWSIFEVED